MSIKKKLLALFATLALAIAATPAFADETASITLPVETKSAHNYSFYQIMTGSPSGNVLGDAKWGQNVNSTYGAEGETVSDTDLSTIAGASGTDAQILATVLPYVDLTGNAYKTAQSSTTSTTEVALEPGYYLIKQTDNPASGEAVTSYIVKVAGDVEVTLKKDGTTSEKKVKDVNDSLHSTQNTNEPAEDAADYDIGDDVPFMLQATIDSRYSDYTTYKLVLHDEQSTGLTFNESSVVVTVGKTELVKGTDYYIYTAENANTSFQTSDGCTFEIVFPDLKNVSVVTASSVIKVNYTSELNESAALGKPGNPNDMWAEFSNNPYDTTSTTTTPKDRVIVFTYSLQVDKTGSDNNALTGAEFTLSKWNATDEGAAGTEGKGTWETVKVITSTENTPLSSFLWTGLDDGTYKLEETVVPSGYNKMADKTFEITAVHSETSDTPSLTSMTVENLGTMTYATDYSKATTTIQNNKGATLPTTGAAGTTLMLLVGAGIACLAAVLLITRKKMSAYQD